MNVDPNDRPIYVSVGSQVLKSWIAARQILNSWLVMVRTICIECKIVKSMDAHGPYNVGGKILNSWCV